MDIYLYISFSFFKITILNPLREGKKVSKKESFLKKLFDRRDLLLYDRGMAWKKKNYHDGGSKYYSTAKKLRRQGKTSEEFEIMLSNLSLEEVIALKLELSSDVAGKRLYGLPIWRSMPNITKDAVIKYALSATRSKGEAARFLGLSRIELRRIEKKY